MTEVKAELVGNLWKIVVEVGQAVEEDDTLMILELMKMEIPITSPTAGTVTADPGRRGRGGPGGSDGRHRRLTPRSHRLATIVASGGGACDDDSVDSSQLDTISVKTSDNVTLGYSVAGLGSRLVAQILDNLLAIPITLIAILLYGGLWRANS